MTWQCKDCGEIHEEQFESCWKCGTLYEGKGQALAPVFTSYARPDDSQENVDLPCSTTPEIPGRKLIMTKGIVCGEAIMGANFLRDLVASITDFVGGRSGAYEKKLRQGREIALQEMMREAQARGGDAVVGIDIDYETVGDSMMMVTASGTAVVLKNQTVTQFPR